MRCRPVVAVSTALALLSTPVLAAVGDSADRPAAGAASSSLTLLDVAVGAQRVGVLQLALRSDIVDGAPVASFVLTPLVAQGKTYGQQTVSSRSAVLPEVDTAATAPEALTAVVRARSPQVAVTSAGGSSSARATSLGAASVLGLPLALDGAASISSGIDGAGAAGGKTLTVTGLGLPSIADLLAAAGLDLRALPPASLTRLTDRLDLTSSRIVEAQQALAAVLAPVQPQVDAAHAVVASTDDTVEAAQVQLAAAEAALAPAVTRLNDATRALGGGSVAGLQVGSLVARGALALPSVGETLGTITSPSPIAVLEPVASALPLAPSPLPSLLPSPAPLPSLVPSLPSLAPAPLPTSLDPVDAVVDSTLGTVTDTVAPVTDAVVPVLEPVLTLPPLTITPELQPLKAAYDAAKKAYDDALAAVETAKAALAAATLLLNDAVTRIETLLTPYTAQVDAVVDAVVDVLDATPLVSLDRLEVTTRSAVTSADAGGQTAEVVGGEVEGLRVLGTDVLDAAVGRSSLEVLDLVGPVKTDLDRAVATLTGAVSSVLSDVPGLPGLTVPAPKVDLLTRATVTDVVDGYGVAGSALRALTVTWPGLHVPAAAALPGASTLPAVTGLPTLPSLGLARTGRLVAAGDVLSQPLTLSVATLEDRARFRPGQLSLAPGGGAPGTDTPTTGAPTTGAPGTGTPGAGTPGAGTPGPGTPGSGTPGTDAPTTGTPGTDTPGTTTANPRPTPVGLTQLPRTGPTGATSVLALLLVASGLAVARRYRTV